jgi:hypothetical protein
MLCIRCGHDNPDGTNFCTKCNAKMLQMAPSGTPGGRSVLELDEHTTYLTPDRRYVTEYMYNLTCRAYEYLHVGESGEPLLEAYQFVKSKIDELEQVGMPEMIAQLQAERSDDPENEYPKQVLYLLNKGITLYREGFGMFDSFVQSGEDQVLIDSIHKMQDANDNLCLAYQVIGTRNQMLEEELRRREVAARQAAAAGAEVGEEEEEVAPVEAPAE